MTKHKCSICGWIYNPKYGLPEGNITPNTPFESLSEDFRCPQCGAKKKWFKKVN